MERFEKQPSPPAEQPSKEPEESVEQPTPEAKKPPETPPKKEEKLKRFEFGEATFAKHSPNEDSYFVDAEKGALGVFDGVGGAPFPVEASRAAKDKLQERIKGIADYYESDNELAGIKESLAKIILEAHQEVLKQAHGGGTTVSFGKIIKGPEGRKKLIFANIGDSRIYVLRKKEGRLELKQITDDDCEEEVKKFEKPVKEGTEIIEESQRQAYFASRHIITRHLGMMDLDLKDNNIKNIKGIESSIGIIDLEEGDLVFATSDGVHDNLADPEIKEVLENGFNQGLPLQEIAKNLVERARQRAQEEKENPLSKEDDITVVALQVPIEKPEEGPKEEKPEVKNLKGILQERREAYIGAFKEHQKIWDKMKIWEKMRRWRNRSRLENAIEEAVKAHIKIGDSEKLKSKNEEEKRQTEERKNKFIQELRKIKWISKELAEKIYEVELKKAEYNEARANYGRELFNKRVEELKSEGKSEENAREQALGEIFTELIVKEQEILQQAQIESLPPKEKGVIRRALDWYLRLPPAARWVISTSLVTGVVIASGGFNAPAIAMFAGQRFVRGLISVGISGGVGKLVGLISSRYIEAKEREALEGLKEQFSLKNLEKVAEDYQKILEETAGRKRKTLVLKAMAMTATGVGTAMGLSMLENAWTAAPLTEVSPTEAPTPEAPTPSEVPTPEVVTPPPGTRVEWQFPGLEKMEGKWINQDSIEIAGKQYDVIKESGRFYIRVGVDTNHDGIAEPGKTTLIDIETGQGTFEGKAVYAYDKDVIFGFGTKDKFELVARSHAMLDITGDGKVESAFWIDEEGVGHLSHGLSPEGVKINDQFYGEWKPDELKNLKIFEHSIKFEHFSARPGVNLNNPEAVAKDLAQQMAAVDSANYDLGPNNTLILNQEKFLKSQKELTEILSWWFGKDKDYFEAVKENGIEVEQWRDWREEIAALPPEAKIAKAPPPPVKKIIPPEAAKAPEAPGVIKPEVVEEVLPRIKLEEGITHIPYTEGELVAKRMGQYVSIIFNGEEIGKGFIRPDGTFYIASDPENTIFENRAFNAARFNLIRAAQGKEMIADILGKPGPKAPFPERPFEETPPPEPERVIPEAEPKTAPLAEIERISGLKPETQAYLDNLIYEDKRIPTEKVLELAGKVKSGELTPEDFGRYYAGKLGAKGISEKLMENLRKNFDLINEGKGAEQLKAIRALTIIFHRLLLLAEQK